MSRAAATLAEIWESDRFTFTTLSVAVRVIRTLIAPGFLKRSKSNPHVGLGG